MAGKNYQLAFEIGGKIAASLPKSFKQASLAVLKLNEELAGIQKQQASVQSLQGMKSKVGQTALEFHKAAAKVEELQKQISATENPSRALTREFERAKTRSSNLRNTLRSQRNELDALKKSYGGADTSAKGLLARERELKLSADRNRESQARSAEQVKRYGMALVQARRNVLQARQAQDELNRSLERQRQLRLQQIGETKGKLIHSGVQTAGLAVGAFAAANNAANFNRQNKVIGQTANMKPQEVEAMGKAMLTTSAITNQFATDVQGAQGYLVAAGQSSKEAQANLLTLGKTATATDSDILDVAKASFTLSDALKINPAQMKTTMGILAQAGKEGNFEFKDMAKTLPVLGAQFQALKMSGTEAAATMGAALQIARKGSSNSDEAANNMNNFMAKILSPETLKKAQKGFGVDLYKVITDAQTKGKNPFEAAMQSVMKMTKNGNQKLLGQPFGDMQVQNFVRPMIQNWEEYQQIKKTSLGVGSTVIDKDFANITKDNAERLKQLKIQASNAANSFGQALQPALSAALAVLVPLVTSIGSFIAKNPTLVSTLVTLAGAFMTVRTAVLATRLAMLALAVATKMTPLGWLQMIIMALVTAGVLLYQNWDKIKAMAMKAWPVIKEYAVKAVEGLKTVFMNFTPVGWLIQAFQAGADVLKSINWSDSGSKIIDTLITGIKAKANVLVDEVKSIFGKVREYLPFSDAKRGPFSQLTKSGGAIMTTLASGVSKDSSLQAAVAGRFSNVSLSTNGLQGSGGISAVGGISAAGQIPNRAATSGVGAAPSITYAPVINLPPGSPKETEAAAKRALDTGHSDFEKRMTAYFQQERRLSFG